MRPTRDGKGEPRPHDCQKKGNQAILYTTDTYGASAPPLNATLGHLDRCSHLPGTIDSTVYGQSRGSPRTFYAHHLAAISASIVYADAETLLSRAVTLSVALARGEGA